MLWCIVTNNVRKNDSALKHGYLRSSWIIVDFPEPEGPTKAFVVPNLAVKDRWCNTNKNKFTIIHTNIYNTKSI